MTASVIFAFFLSRIDYCKSLLFGSTHDVLSHLQGMQFKYCYTFQNHLTKQYI